MSSSRAGETHLVWVYFRDKDRTGDTTALLSRRAIERRARRGSIDSPTFEDLPVSETSVRVVGERVHRLRHVSRWLNAVSVEADAQQIEILAGLSFVSHMDLVRRYRRIDEDLTVTAADSRLTTEASDIEPIDYGSSVDQLEQIQVPAVISSMVTTMSRTERTAEMEVTEPAHSPS